MSILVHRISPGLNPRSILAAKPVLVAVLSSTYTVEHITETLTSMGYIVGVDAFRKTPNSPESYFTVENSEVLVDFEFIQSLMK